MTKQAPVFGACFLMQRLTVSLFLLMIILFIPHRQPLLHELFAALRVEIPIGLLGGAVSSRHRE